MFQGSGTVTLTTANNYLGSTMISGVTLVAADSMSYPSTSTLTTGTAGASDGTLLIAAGHAVRIPAMAIQGSPVIGAANRITLDATSGTLIFHGNINQAVPTNPNSAGYRFLGNVDIGTGVRNWNTTNCTLWWDGSFAGTARIDVPGTGDVRASGQSTFSGGTRFMNRAVYLTGDSVGSGAALVSGPFGTGTVEFQGLQILQPSDIRQLCTIGNTVAILSNIAIASTRFSGPVQLGSGVRTITTSFDGDRHLVVFDGPITSAATGGLTVEGAGAVILGADNSSMMGTFRANSGGVQVNIRNSRALGTAAGGTVIRGAAQLLVEANVSGEPLHLDGTVQGSPGLILTPDLVVLEPFSWTGDVTYNASAEVAGEVHGGVLDATPNSGSGTLFLTDAIINRFTTGSLTVSRSAKLRVASEPRASRLTSLQHFDGSSSKIDLTENGLVVDYNTSSPIATFTQLVTQGRNGGAWNGAGINSSTAAADATSSLGIATSVDLFGGMSGNFLSEPVDSTAVLIRWTLSGDADLNGVVDVTDFSLLAVNFNKPSRWFGGDFDYSGITTVADFALLASNFNRNLTPSLNPRVGIPEPSFCSTTTLMMLAMRRIARRRRIGRCPS